MLKKEDILKEANFVINENGTIRDASLLYNRSKSSIHQDLKVRLKRIDLPKWKQVEEILKEHKKTKHIKGGERTKQKYKNLKRV